MRPADSFIILYMYVNVHLTLCTWGLLRRWEAMLYLTRASGAMLPTECGLETFLPVISDFSEVVVFPAWA